MSEEHVYECPSAPNEGLRIVHMDKPDGFGGVIPGSIWCWHHGTWDLIPEWWSKREAELRTEVLEKYDQWQEKQTGKVSLVPFTSTLGERMAQYANLRGIKVPNMEERYEVFRFADTVKRAGTDNG